MRNVHGKSLLVLSQTLQIALLTCQLSREQSSCYNPTNIFYYFFFLLGLCSTHTPGRPEVHFVLTKGKAIPKQHEDCRGFSLWEQMAVLNPTQSFYSLEPSLNQHLMTWTQRKNFCPSRFGSPGQGTATLVCLAWRYKPSGNLTLLFPKSVSPRSYILQRGILPCGRHMGVEKGSGWVHWIQL